MCLLALPRLGTPFSILALSWLSLGDGCELQRSSDFLSTQKKKKRLERGRTCLRDKHFWGYESFWQNVNRLMNRMLSGYADCVLTAHDNLAHHRYVSVGRKIIDS